MKVLIAGGTGLIGRQLSKELVKQDLDVVILSRKPEKVISTPQRVEVVQWDGVTTQGWGDLINECQAVVNLAGENIGGEGFLPSRLSETRKKRIRDSRVQSSQALVAAIDAAERKPKVFVQSSAIGYYGFHGDEMLTEESPPGDDFFAEWRDWEPVSRACGGDGHSQSDHPHWDLFFHPQRQRAQSPGFAVQTFCRWPDW